jgi:GT2 family glycosyltransferase
VVVVDQTPDADVPHDFYKAFGALPLRLLPQQEPSLTLSRNEGAQQAHGDWLWFLDDDMSFGPDLLATHLQVRAQEQADAVYGGVSEQESMPERYERHCDRLDPVSFFLKSPNCRWSGMVLCVSGANLLIRRDLFLRLGGFDPALPRMEDIELGYRLFRAGAKLWYSDKPFARHMKAASGGTRKTQPDRVGVKLFSKIYLHRKHFPGWTTKQYLLQVSLSALLFRDVLSGADNIRNILAPFYPVRMLAKIWTADRRARKALRSRGGAECGSER